MEVSENMSTKKTLDRWTPKNICANVMKLQSDLKGLNIEDISSHQDVPFQKNEPNIIEGLPFPKIRVTKVRCHQVISGHLPCHRHHIKKLGE